MREIKVSTFTTTLVAVSDTSYNGGSNGSVIYTTSPPALAKLLLSALLSNKSSV
jgi:hypothetical protein